MHSMLELLGDADQTHLCVQGDTLCTLSSTGQTLSILQFSWLANEAGQPPNLISSQGRPYAPNTSLSDVSSHAAHLTSLPAGPSSYAQPQATGFRSPLPISAEPSSTILRSGSSAGYSGHRANEEALHSLLDTTPEPAVPSTAEPFERTLSGGLASTIRPQPLLYSRGASTGGSSNSASAMHIRKKRAGMSISPRHTSPRHSLFDAGWEEGNRSNVDVDLSRQAPNTTSPRSASSGFSFESTGFDRVATPAAHLRNAHHAGDAEDIDSITTAAPEAYVSCLVRVQLPVRSSSPNAVSARLTGEYDSVVGPSEPLLAARIIS
jgi:hypothetical protein